MGNPKLPHQILFCIVLLCLSNPVKTNAQTKQKNVTLQEVINIAREQSLDAIMARHQFRTNYWEFRSYKAKYLPKLTLRSDFPQFNRELVKYQNPDGSYSYVEENVNTTTLDLQMRHNVGLTGGYLNVNTDLQRIDQFGKTDNQFYRSSPVSISYNQPMLFYNEYKWEKKIEPLKYKKAKKQYLKSLEESTIKAVKYFFELLLAQKNLEIARANYANADTLYKISQKRYKIGKIPENELMNIKHRYLNAETNMNEAKVDMKAAKIRLRSFLGFNENVDFELATPSDIPDMDIDVSKAKELAKENNPKMLEYDQQLLQSRQEVAKSKAEKGIDANLFARFGLARKANNLGKAYQSPRDQERLTVGVEIPLVDWGMGKGKYNMAKSRQKVRKTDIKRSRREFEQNVALKVMQFNLQDEQVKAKKQANLTAQKRYEITQKRFRVGKVGVLELNDASQKQDKAKRNYIQALRSYWQDYYRIRSMTLYDFVEQRKLDEEFGELHE